MLFLIEQYEKPDKLLISANSFLELQQKLEKIFKANKSNFTKGNEITFTGINIPNSNEDLETRLALANFVNLCKSKNLLEKEEFLIYLQNKQLIVKFTQILNIEELTNIGLIISCA